MNLYSCGACAMPIFGDDTDDGPNRMIFLWWRPVGHETPDYEGFRTGSRKLLARVIGV